MKRVLRIGALVIATLLLVVVVGFLGWTRIARYPAFDAAETLAQEHRTEVWRYVFEPEDTPETGIVFYPGGLVAASAYAPLMQQVSEGGPLVVIAPMPLELAVFGIGRADDVIDAYPEIDHWVIAGHSLGGAMAAQWTRDNADKIDGLVLLASYPAESTDLSALEIEALSIYGTEDGVPGDVFEASLERLPDSTVLVELDGGNHAQFGDYGPQKGDGTATMSRDEQQRLTAEAILELVARIER